MMANLTNPIAVNTSDERIDANVVLDMQNLSKLALYLGQSVASRAVSIVDNRKI